MGLGALGMPKGGTGGSGSVGVGGGGKRMRAGVGM